MESTLIKPAVLAWYRSRKYGVATPRFEGSVVTPSPKVVELPRQEPIRPQPA